LRRYRIVHSELVENPDHNPPDLLVGAIRRGKRIEQPVEALRDVARVDGIERRLQVNAGALGVSLKPDPRRKAVGGKAARHVRDDRERLVGVALLEQYPGQRDRGVTAGGLELERAAERLFVAAFDQRVGL
jgi:hypothetical protein